MKEEELIINTNAYKLIGDKCHLSERTVRTAFSKKPITWQTAMALCRALRFDTTNCFVIKEDNRGRGKKKAAKEPPKKQKKITHLKAKQ